MAAEILDRLDISEPVSPWELAAALGVRICAGPRGRRATIVWVDGEWVARVDPNARLERAGVDVLHEIAHRLLVQRRLPNNERHAWWLTAALLLPQTPFLRELRRACGAVDELAVAFPHASQEMLARRQVQLAASLRLWVWDVAPRRRRYSVSSGGWLWGRSDPHRVELDAMRWALDECAPVEPIGGVRAWPVFDGNFQRVLCVTDGEIITRL